MTDARETLEQRAAETLDWLEQVPTSAVERDAAQTVRSLLAEIERLRAKLARLESRGIEDMRHSIEAALEIPEPELDPYGDGPVGGGGTTFIAGWRAHQRATVKALKGGAS